MRRARPSALIPLATVMGCPVSGGGPGIAFALTKS